MQLPNEEGDVHIIWALVPGTTMSRERPINIFMSMFVYIFTFIQKTSSKSKSSVLTDCSELDSEIILSECRIVGALEGTWLELGVRQLHYSYILTGTIQQFRTSRTTGAGLLKALETWTNASKPWASLPHSRNTCCNSIKDGIM